MQFLAGLEVKRVPAEAVEHTYKPDSISVFEILFVHVFMYMCIHRWGCTCVQGIYTYESTCMSTCL